MTVSIVAAISDNGIIGRENDLPWRLPRDLKRFKRLTMGHHLLVGRKTFEAIGRPLPGRRMVVLTLGSPALPPDVERASSLDEALSIARRANDPEPFVAGGEQIYRLALPVADRLYITRVHGLVDGDARFPSVDPTTWKETARAHFPVSPENGLPLTFLRLDRVAPSADRS